MTISVREFESSSDVAAAPSESRSAWARVFTACIVYALGPALFLGTAALFIGPLMKETGLSAGQLQVSSTMIVALSYGGAVVGMLVNRVGSRRLMLVGLVALALMEVALTVVPLTPIMVYVMGALLGLCGSMCYVVPCASMLTTWFKGSFGMAMGVVGAVAALLPLLVGPVVGSVIDTSGWRAGYLLLAGLVLVVALPIALSGVRENPFVVSWRAKSSGERREKLNPKTWQLMGNPRLWALMLGCALATFSYGGFLFSLRLVLSAAGWPVGAASYANGAYLVGAAVGCAVTGILLDKRNPYVISLTVLVLSGILALVFVGTYDSAPFTAVVLMTSVIGSSGAAAIVIAGYLTRCLLGDKAFPVGFGMCALMVGFSLLSGTMAFVAIQAHYGSFGPALVLGGASLVAGGALTFASGYGTSSLQVDKT